MSSTTQLLILGNGFDRQCGLDSHYEAFFRRTILDTIGERFDLCQMQAGVSGFWETMLFVYYTVYKNTDYKWSDVETIINDILCAISFGSHQAGTNLMYGLWNEAIKCIVHKQDPEEWAKSLTNLIDCNLFMYCYSFYLPFSSQTNFASNPGNLQKLLNHLLQELHGFEKRFCKYLKDNLVNPENAKQLNTKYIVNAVNLLAKLTGFTDKSFDSLNNIISTEQKLFEEKISETSAACGVKPTNVLSKPFTNLKNTHILSFNYTSLFDLLEVDSPCLYSNVHGKLCNRHCSNDCSTSNIIFGIDDNLIQLDNSCSELRIFSKTYRKMYDTHTPTSILPPNNVPLTIMFYGHSLSQADYSYFQSIFDYYDLYSNSKVSLIFYYSEGYEQTDAIYRLINSYGTSLSNREQGKNLMHKLLLENRLKIEKVS